MNLEPIDETSDPDTDWRRINHALEALRMLFEMVIAPSGAAAALRTDGQRVMLDLSGFVTQEQFIADSRGMQPPPPPSGGTIPP